MRHPIQIVSTGLLLVLFHSLAFAIPNAINLQGRLTDLNGNPLTQTTQVDFYIYQGGTPTNPDSGLVVYKERAVITPGPDGIYEHKIGEGTPLEGHTLASADFLTNQPVYLQLIIGGSPLMPRLLFKSNSYSFVSAVAESVVPGSIRQESLQADSFQSPGVGVVPQGAILMFLTTCPAGFSEVTELRQRYPLGADTTGLSALVPDAPNMAAGSLGHTHNIAHTHVVSSPNYGPTQVIGTGQDYVAFSDPKLILGTAAWGQGDNIELRGVSVSYSSINQSTTLSGVTETLPPSLTVMFCKKD